MQGAALDPYDAGCLECVHGGEFEFARLLPLGEYLVLDAGALGLGFECALAPGRLDLVVLLQDLRSWRLRESVTGCWTSAAGIGVLVDERPVGKEEKPPE